MAHVNYYCDAAAGSDSNNGLTTGAAFATVQKAEDEIVAGTDGTAGTDTFTVYMKGTFDAGSSTVLTLGANGGDFAITYEGYTTTPGDGGKCAWVTTGTYNVYGSNTRRRFRNIDCSGGGYWRSYGTGQTIENVTQTGGSYFLHGGYGVLVDVHLSGTTNGFYPYDGNLYVRCSAEVSTASGAYIYQAQNYNRFVECLFSDNAVDIRTNGNGDFTAINCTFTDATSHSIQPDASASGYHRLRNCSFTDSSGYAINTSTSGSQTTKVDIRDCHFHNNSSGNIHADIISDQDSTDGGDSIVTNLVTGDPSFTDAGAQDFSFASGSPLENAVERTFFGTGTTTYRDIGAIQNEAGGGGGIAQTLHTIEAGISA
tara:strand:- start:36 stop:1145 length:1110 start_codon:yes stop_codon:yes gene_type:complete